MRSDLQKFIQEVLLEVKPSELISMTSQKVIDKSRDRPATLARVDRPNNVWTFRVSGEYQNYTVKVKVLDTDKKTAGDSDILVTCNCPFFRWQGPEHWARAEKYLYQSPAGTASKPVIQDPEGVKKICKHAVSALRKMEGYLL